MLFIVLMVLGLFIPRLRVVLGLRLFINNPWRWFMICWGVSCAGLDTLHIWGTLAELPIGFAWSAVYIAALTALRLALLPFVKKQSTIGNHHF